MMNLEHALRRGLAAAVGEAGPAQQQPGVDPLDLLRELVTLQRRSVELQQQIVDELRALQALLPT
jgi:hypothetical protein